MSYFGNYYGSYTTIDAPVKNKIKAFSFLVQEFRKIGGNVRYVLNSHDSGVYPSFEVDYSKEIEEIVEIESDLDIRDERREKLDEWHKKANEIQEKYYQKFEKWL